MGRIVVRGVVFSLFILCLSLRAGEIPVLYLDHVVAIGRKETAAGPNQGRWVGEATGFFYGQFISKVSDTLSNYQPYLVTNRHVIEEHIAATSEPLSIRLNPEAGGAAQEIDFPLFVDGKPTWHVHPDSQIDLAVVTLNGPWLKQSGFKFGEFRGDVDSLSRAKAKELGLSEGNGIFVMGFPMNLVGQEQDYVIVRQGCIARVSDSLNSPALVKTFLIDSFAFPGNSGSPVVLRPEPLEAQFPGEKPPIRQAYLLGVVRSYLPYTDMAVSPQTKHLRVTFEENSGLTEVIPADYIEEAIESAKKNP